MKTNRTERFVAQVWKMVDDSVSGWQTAKDILHGAYLYTISTRQYRDQEIIRSAIGLARVRLSMAIYEEQVERLKSIGIEPAQSVHATATPLHA